MVSVIIPCYNSVDHVERAIKSVLDQSYADYEIILVDNNSTDDTFGLITRYAQNFSGKISAYKELKKGAPAARNLGLKHSKGDWIQFLDADDELLPDKLLKQYELASETIGDIVVGDFYIDEQTETLEKKRTEQKANENVWLGLILSRLGRTSALLWRAEALKAINGWDEKLTSSQEYNLLFKILKNNEVVSFSQTIDTIVHVRGNSISKSTNKERESEIIENFIRLRITIREFLKSNKKIDFQTSRKIDEYLYRIIIDRDRMIAGYSAPLLAKHRFDISTYFYLKCQIHKLIYLVKKP